MSSKEIRPIGVPEWGEDRQILFPMKVTTKAQWCILGFLLILLAWGIAGFLYQLKMGLGITGLNRPLYWGYYITHFVFFIGISHAGTLVSAILRMANAEWRRPITRIAETITAIALMTGVCQILIDMGRADRMLNIVFYPQPQSPLFWDVCSVTLYMASSLTYLYVPMIPDLAMCREEWKETGGWRYTFYRVLSLGWQGGEEATRRLHKIMNFLMILIIPVAVSVHTVISYIFAMTIQPMWHSSIFGPYFVVGAIFSGVGMLMIAMAVFRKLYHFEKYLKLIHFKQLGIFLLGMNCIWFYFTLGEYLTTLYKDDPVENAVFMTKMTGEYATLFWIMIGLMAVSFFILAIPRLRTINGFALSGVLINIGMWLERYLIITPTLSNPRLPIEPVSYSPTFWEWGTFVGALSGFVMLYLLFAKLFPLISAWEMKEGREDAIPEVVERYESYMPDTAEAES